ncbi:MAG: hypothetical protein C4333_07215 [Meiothermus sp.]
MRRLLWFALLLAPAWASPCSLSYLPTDGQLAWRYRLLGSDQTYVQSYSLLGSQGFVEISRFERQNQTDQRRWSCTPEGLQPQIQGPQPIPGGAVEFVRLSGVFWPPERDWRVGHAWSYRYELRGRVAFVELGGYLEARNRIVGRERVQVPAGSFEALRVESVFQGRLGIGLGGKSTYWFARGVGLVKQVSEGNLPGRLSSELLELLRTAPPEQP